MPDIDEGKIHKQNLEKRDVEVDRGQRKLPLLLLVRDTGERTFFLRGKIYRVHFMCPVCGCKARSGPKEKGYKLVVHGKWSRRVLLAVHLSLCLLQFALTVTGVPVPVAAVSQMALQSLGAVREEFISTLGLSAAYVNGLEDAFRAADLSVESAIESAAATIETCLDQQAEQEERLEGLSGDVSGGSTGGRSAQQPREYRISAEHIAAVEDLLAHELKDPRAALSGLVKADPGNNLSAWVCKGPGGDPSACKEAFRRFGERSFTVVMKYD